MSPERAAPIPSLGLPASEDPAAATSPGPPLLPVTSDAELAVDAGVVALGSLAISLFAHRLALMTALVPGLLALRLVLWWRASRARRAPLGAELLLFALCTVLGGLNDWNTVVRHRVYDYTVPVYFPELSTIPLWMLLFWGLVLRLMLTVAAWGRLGAGARSRDAVRLGARLVPQAVARVGLMLLLLLVTRQGIYRLAQDPILSWLPFACALAIFPLLFGLDRHEIKILGLTLVAGPLVEVLYIQVAGLHRYHLGWLGGVPLWILLWWLLAILLWKDLGRRAQARLEAWLGGRP